MTRVVVTPHNSIALEPGACVLKAAEYAAFVEAGDIVRLARERAEALGQQARAEYEEHCRKGFEAGRDEGKAEIAMQMLETITASVEQLAGMESSLVDVVMRSLHTILGDFDRRDLVAGVVGHALRLVRDEKRITLRVAAEDADAVQERLADMARRYPGIGRIDVTADSSLGRGGCIMETEIGVVDASLDRQLAMIEESLRRHIEEKKS